MSIWLLLLISVFSLTQSNKQSCPEELRLKYMKDNFKPYTKGTSIRNRISIFMYELPKKFIDSVFLILELSKTQLYEQNQTNSVILNRKKVLENYLKKITKSSCYDFMKYKDIPLIFSIHDDLGIRHITNFIDANSYIHPSCQDKECTFLHLFKIIIQTPIFIFSKHLPTDPEKYSYLLEFNKILVPNFYLISEEFTQVENYLNTTRKGDLWENKQERLFWRGAPTTYRDYQANGIIQGAYHGSFSTVGLILEAIFMPEIIDAKFSETDFRVVEKIGELVDFVNRKIGKCLYGYRYILEMDSESLYAEEIVKMQIKPEFRDLRDHLRYKYLISLDENTASFGRELWILSSNSLLVKPKSHVVQYFYGEMVEGLHYKSISDRFEIQDFMEWARKNDDQAKHIATKGAEFFNDFLTRDKIERVWFTILRDYYLLYDNKY